MARRKAKARRWNTVKKSGSGGVAAAHTRAHEARCARMVEQMRENREERLRRQQAEVRS